MALTPSTMLALGTPRPDFDLADALSGGRVRAADFDGAPALCVMFLCNHCPFVVHVRDEVTRIAAEYSPKGVAFVAINSNDVENYPDDAPPRMKELAEELGWAFPFLHDETQEVAKAYQAACTPDFFVFGANAELAYRGRLDGSRPGNGVPVDGDSLRAALDAVLAAKPVAADQVASVGCNIKWKPGNAPDYFG